jgi:competence protein ComEC
MPMFQFALAFLAGNLWLQCQSIISLVYLTPLCLAYLCLRAVRCLRAWLPYSTLVAAIAGFMCAFVTAQVCLQEDLSPAFEGQELIVSGYVNDIPMRESYGQRFMFNIESSEVPLPKTIELTWYEESPRLSAGQRWQLHIKLKRRHGFANPGASDYEAQLFRRGIGATGYVTTKGDQRLLVQVDGLWVLKLRQRLVNQIAAAIPQSSMQGVIRGLSVGDQQAISDQAWQVFARTGTSHLMAISGFHVGMVAVITAWLGSWLIYFPQAQRFRITAQDLKAVFGMAGAIGYSLLAGMSVPTQRTLIMLAVYYGASYFRREVNVWHSYGLALVLVLIVDPLAALSVGAWLSFGAVAAILINQQGRLVPASGFKGFLSIQGLSLIHI